MRATEQCQVMMAMRTVLMVSAFMLSCHSLWAQALHRLSSAQIKQQFTGKVLTDGTHFRETYLAGGKLIVNEMSHSPATGSWRVNNDQLCKVLPGILDACYEVWGADGRIELHFGNAPPLEAFLRSATTK
jgi:hypothetical protein